jgi:hypothetical protein
MASPKQLLAGEYGRLKPISSPFKTTDGVAVNVVCRCGVEKLVLTKNLLSGRTRSCGCLKRQVSQLLSQYDQNGDLKRSALAEYRAFRSAEQRCNNPRASKYESCGGLGIKFHEAWTHDFPKFYEDLGPAKPGQILTRRDLRKDFTPQNCFWGTWNDRSEAERKYRQKKSKLTAIPEAA